MNNENWIVDINGDNEELWFPEIENLQSREEAIQAGMEVAKNEGLKAFKIGVIEYATVPDLDGCWILEQMQEQLNNDYAEASDGYLDDVTSEHEKELADKINEVIYQWSKEHNYLPSCFTIYEGETIEVNEKR